MNSDIEGIHRRLDEILPAVKAEIKAGQERMELYVGDQMRTLVSQQKSVVAAVRQLTRIVDVKEGVALPDVPMRVPHSMAPPLAAARKRR